LPPDLPDGDASQLEPDLAQAMRLAWARRVWPLYLHGPPGVGKTFAAAAVFRACAASVTDEAAPRPRWWLWPSFCDALARVRTAREGQVEQYEASGRVTYLTEPAIWRRVASASLIVIDDIGTRTANDLRMEAMWRVLECRQRRPTILTSNLDQAAIARVFDERILSRLFAGTAIDLRGCDRRAQDWSSRRVVVKTSEAKK
jgi:DNA replication protein DnaC